MTVRIELLTSLANVPAAAWDALTGQDDPFVEHAFLHTLETTGSVGRGTGWQPLHVAVWDDAELVAALPLYAKSHSYGEYTFDFGWAHAASRAGIRYYPKLTSMVPFTPATGRRILLHPTRDARTLVAALAQGIDAAARETKASGAHILYLAEEERALVPPGWSERLGYQFHWHAQGDKTFDDYLARFRAETRKQVKRERRRIVEAGLVVRTVTGPELAPGELATLDRFYRDTCARKGSEAYLAEGFFEALADTSSLGRLVAVLAYDAGTLVGGTINFEKGRHVYGRYWGCAERYDALHFELCYYRLIERAIERGCVRFEAGAQGEHKIKRGLVPSAVHSAHWLRHEGLADAVAEFVQRERPAVLAEMRALSHDNPFHREHR